MLQVGTLVVSEIAQNCRVLWCSETMEGVIVDPGGEAERILQAVKGKEVKVTGIWLTHSHLDHCAGVAPLLEKSKVPLSAHPGERVLRESVSKIAAMYGFSPAEWPNCPEPDIPLTGGEEVGFGQERAKVLFTPGHSPGHLAFYFEDAKVVISGDTLFAGSIGRTDLPGGNHAQLIRSIKDALMTLPDETVVLSGHGEDTTVGRERRSNPFLRG